jgi:hypothetical protein
MRLSQANNLIASSQPDPSFRFCLAAKSKTHFWTLGQQAGKYRKKIHLYLFSFLSPSPFLYHPFL